MSEGAEPTRGTRWAIRAGVVLLRLLASTWRYRVIDDEGLREARAAKRPLIFAFWHGQMLPLLYQHRNEGVAILISEHRDGEIIARVAEALGYRSVRGSTTRGAGRALIGLVRAISNGYDVAITPDGPRGPARSFAPGALIASQRTGASIIPVAISAPRSWRLKSWDAFMIPKPFARIVVAYGVPTAVAAAALRDSAAEAPRFTQMIEDAERVAHAG